MPTEQQTETRREIAQKIVREWSEHDMNEHYGSDYLRDDFGSEHLEARIEAALKDRDERAARMVEGIYSDHPSGRSIAAAIRNEGNQ